MNDGSGELVLQTSQWKDDSPMLFSGKAGYVESSDERCVGRARFPPSTSILRWLSILTLEHAKMMQKMYCYLPLPIESTPFQRSLARRDPSNLDGTPTVRAVLGVLLSLCQY